MPRITCRTPSTGKAIAIRVAALGIAWTVVAEAPDFSVPDATGQFPVRDPLDASRAVKPGEVTFQTPIYARNLTTVTRWIEVQLLTEAGVPISSPGRFAVPAGDTFAIPVQSLSLFKRVAAAANGDRLRLRAEADAAFDCWGAADEQMSSEHIGVTA